MKNLFRLFFLVVSIFFYSCINAQNFEGKIIMKMEVLNAPPEIEQMKSMLESNIITYAKGKKSRVEMTNPMSGNTIVITDLNKNEVVLCMDMMGQKTAVVSTADEYSKQKNDPSTKVEYFPTNETKTIAGHLCKKTIAKMEADGKKIDMEIWYAPDILNTNLEMSDVPGMPLEYSMNMEQFNLHFIASEVNIESVPDSKFEVPSDYVRKSAEEFQKQMGGGAVGK